LVRFEITDRFIKQLLTLNAKLSSIIYTNMSTK